MKRSAIFAFLLFLAGFFLVSCNNSNRLNGYEWLEGTWEGTLTDAYGKPVNWAEVEIEGGNFKLTAAPALPYFKNGKSTPVSIGRVFNKAADMVVLALDETGMLYIDEDAMQLMVCVNESGSIRLDRRGGNPMHNVTAPTPATPSIPSTPSATSATTSGNLVYSCAYDGYVNIRSAATTKSGILCQLRNGPDGAVVIGKYGNWVRVRYNGVEGYVHTSYISDKPSVPVTSGVTADWLEGIWSDGTGGHYCFIFNDGRFAMWEGYYNGGDYTSYGLWRLEGNSIKFIDTYDEMTGQAVVRVHTSIISGGRVGGLNRVQTWSGFPAIKKRAASKVRGNIKNYLGY